MFINNRLGNYMNISNKSVLDTIMYASKGHPNHRAIVLDHESLTYAQLINNSLHIAAYLTEMGIKKGTKIAIYAQNYLNWIPLYIGIMRAGGVAVLINSYLTIDGATPLISFTDVEYVFFGKTHSTNGSDDEINILSDAFNIPSANIINVLTFDFSKSNVDILDNVPENTQDDSFIIFTSGSSAKPKAVVLSQHGLVNTAIRFGTGWGIPDYGKLFNCAPMFHILGIQLNFIAMFKGCTVFYTATVKPDVISDYIYREHIECVGTVATNYQTIVDTEELLDKTSPYLKKCLTAGSYISPATFVRFENAFKNAVFLNAYGLTETHGPVTFPRFDDPAAIRYNTVGRSIEDAEVAIWDTDNNCIAPAGITGEIIARGYHVKNSYYKLPDEDQCIDSDGWFHSGDLGIMDKAGNIKIVGRIKDIIIKGGENISPPEIESALASFPEISSCRIFGYKDAVYGENIGACVCIREGMIFDEQDVRARLKATVGSFKVPARFFIYDALPVNDVGKIDSKALREDMLRRVKKLTLRSEFANGTKVFDFSASGSKAIIGSVSEMIKNYIINFGYPASSINKIMNAINTLLSGRILDAEFLPEFSVSLICYDENFKIIYHDNDIEYGFDSEKASELLAKIVADYGEGINLEVETGRRQKLHLTFDYEDSFVIEDFWMENEPMK